MLYSPKEEAKRSRWKKHWLKQKLLAQSYIKLNDLRKGNTCENNYGKQFKGNNKSER